MNQEIRDLQEERSKLFSDFYNNKTPKRMPLEASLPYQLIAEYGGLSPVDFQYDYSKLREPALALSKKVYSDSAICRPVALSSSRSPSHYQLLESQSFVMGNNGFMQHPEVSGMEATEYPELIEAPFAFLIEKVIPRQYKKMDLRNPIETLMRYTMSEKAMVDEMMSSMPWFTEMIAQNGFYPGSPRGAFACCEAPFDYIADQLRGFSGMSMDIRRHKSEIKEAVNAVLPLMFHFGMPDAPHPEGGVFTPLHMPPFMREKDFAELWFPTYKILLEQFASKGARVKAFCEGDWTRYLDYLQELPAGTQLVFEYGDPKLIKEKLGGKFLIQGLYPLELLKQGTKEACIDKAKELLDVMMPGGGYIFGFDKTILTMADVNLDNLIALFDFLHEYAIYDNPGESFGTPLNSEGFVYNESIIKPLQSKYFFDWEGFKRKNPLIPDSAKPRFDKYNRECMKRILGMLY